MIIGHCYKRLSAKFDTLSKYGISKPFTGGNNDGKTDIFAVNNAGALVILNISNGTFRFDIFYVDYSKIANIQSSIVSDINNDGKFDIIIGTNLNSDAYLNIFLNNGDGSFSPLPVDVIDSIRILPCPTNMILSDVNHDGKGDIIAICGYNNFIIIMNLGDGLFSPEKIYRVGVTISNLITADINDDGKIDIIFPSSNSVRIFVNTGSGTFHDEISCFTGSKVSYVTSGDVNNDTKVDLIIAYENDNKISIIINAGSGTFKYPISYSPSVDFYSKYLTTFDVNGDKKLDIIVAINGYAKIVILYNIDGVNFYFETINLILPSQNCMSPNYILPPNCLSPIHISPMDINNDNITDLFYLSERDIGILSSNCD